MTYIKELALRAFDAVAGDPSRNASDQEAIDAAFRAVAAAGLFHSQEEKAELRSFLLHDTAADRARWASNAAAKEAREAAEAAAAAELAAHRAATKATVNALVDLHPDRVARLNYWPADGQVPAGMAALEVTQDCGDWDGYRRSVALAKSEIHSTLRSSSFSTWDGREKVFAVTILLAAEFRGENAAEQAAIAAPLVAQVEATKPQKPPELSPEEAKAARKANLRFCGWTEAEAEEGSASPEAEERVQLRVRARLQAQCAAIDAARAARDAARARARIEASRARASARSKRR